MASEQHDPAKTSPIGGARLLLQWALSSRRALLFAVFSTILFFSILELCFPRILQLYIDLIGQKKPLLFGHDFSFLTSLSYGLYVPAVALILLAGLRWLTTFYRSVLQTRLTQGSLFDLRNRIYDTIQSLSFGYHDRSYSGTLISNVVEDLGQVSRFFENGLFPILESVLYAVVVYAMLFSTFWPAALGSLILVVAGASVTAFFSIKGYHAFSRTRTLYADTVQQFTENVEGHLVVRAFGQEQPRSQKYNSIVVNYHKAVLNETLMSSVMSQSLIYATVFGIFIVMGIALWQWQIGHWNPTPGQLFFLFFLQSSLTHRVRLFSRGLDQTLRLFIAASRLSGLIVSREFLPDRGTRRIPENGPGSLHLTNVGFAYGDKHHALLNINVHIKAGTTLGLVGSTGSGKSTLALLLGRFYDTSEGRILIDGHDIKDYVLSDIRHQFSLVFQDTFLFSASVRDNITFGNPYASYEDVVHAATIAQSHDFIMALPKGYDTEVGERGVALSGGQRQRLSIARAILRRPRFLILDDCTSALDPLTEKAVQTGLDALREMSTVIIIAHRFSSIASADNIIVMERGCIVEEGTPQQLNTPGTALSRILNLSHRGIQ